MDTEIRSKDVTKTVPKVGSRGRIQTDPTVKVVIVDPCYRFQKYGILHLK